RRAAHGRPGHRPHDADGEAGTRDSRAGLAHRPRREAGGSTMTKVSADLDPMDLSEEPITGAHDARELPERAGFVIVGSGFAGLCMAIKLKESGRDDFVILEKAGDVGGTWRENTYPGAGCDIQSHLYSFSFELNPKWSRMFARQP